VATRYERALSDPENEGTVEGLGPNLIRLIPSVIQAFLAEVRNESEALDVVEWVYCREDEGAVGEEPKAQQCRPGVRAAWTVWTVWAGAGKEIYLLPRSGAVEWMGEMVVGEKVGNEKVETPVLEVKVASLPIRGEMWAMWWDQ